MLARWLIGLLADLVFNGAAADSQSYAAQFHRYLKARGFTTDGTGKLSEG